MEKVISLCDFSEYEAGNCGDGGKYGFKTVFQKLPDGKYKVCYETTSHMEFCDKCGEWHDPRTCQQDYEVISDQEVAARVKAFENNFCNDPKCWVETE